MWLNGLDANFGIDKHILPSAHHTWTWVMAAGAGDVFVKGIMAFLGG